jgi:hypothetical protein
MSEVGILTTEVRGQRQVKENTKRRTSNAEVGDRGQTDAGEVNGDK